MNVEGALSQAVAQLGRVCKCYLRVERWTDSDAASGWELIRNEGKETIFILQLISEAVYPPL